MGSFAAWHWLIVLLVIAVPLAILWLLVRLLRRRGDRGTHPQSLTAGRLQQLDALRAQGSIDDAEYQRKRSEILQEL